MQTDHELLGPLQEYDDVVPLDATRLVTRARRAQRRRRVGAVTVATMVAAVLVALPLTTASREDRVVVAAPHDDPAAVTPAPVADPALTPEVRARLLERADAAASSNSGTADRVEVVGSTVRDEAAPPGGWTTEDEPDWDVAPPGGIAGDEPIWVVQVTGDFVCGGCSRPYDVDDSPAGRYLTLTLQQSNYQGWSFSIGPERSDLARLGDVTVLRPE